MRTFLNHIKNETLDEIKISLENLWQRMIQLSEFFQYSFVLILKRKCLLRASRVYCEEYGKPFGFLFIISRYRKLFPDIRNSISRYQEIIPDIEKSEMNLIFRYLEMISRYQEMISRYPEINRITDIRKWFPDIGKSNTFPDIGKSIPDIRKSFPDIGKLIIYTIVWFFRAPRWYIGPTAMPRAAVTPIAPERNEGTIGCDSRPRHCRRDNIPAWRPNKITLLSLLQLDLTMYHHFISFACGSVPWGALV